MRLCSKNYFRVELNKHDQTDFCADKQKLSFPHTSDFFSHTDTLERFEEKLIYQKKTN